MMPWIPFSIDMSQLDTKGSKREIESVQLQVSASGHVATYLQRGGGGYVRHSVST